MIEKIKFISLMTFCLFCVFNQEKAVASQFDNAIKQKFFTVPMSHSNLEKIHTASTLVVTCVDFRFRDEVAYLLNDILGLNDDYDEVALPGASLAFVNSSKESWEKTMDEIIDLLKDLHKIKRVIFIDHLGCGAYKLLKGEENVKTLEIERSSHLDTFEKARKKMKKDFPDLEVYTFLMDFDGKIENSQDE